MKRFLQSTEVIDWTHPNVLKTARTISGDKIDLTCIAQRCFEWVRDEIKHSRDYQMNPVTCSASEVLEAGTGYCDFSRPGILFL